MRWLILAALLGCNNQTKSESFAEQCKEMCSRAGVKEINLYERSCECHEEKK